MHTLSETDRIWERPTFALIVLPLLAFLLNRAFFTAGFYADDFFFLNIFGDHPQPFSWWKGLWSVESYAGFEYLWWQDPNWTASFWRPIPSLVIGGSLWLFGENPFPLHLLALLLHAGITVSLYWLVRRLTGSGAFALLVGFVFVTCEDHALTVGWIATITDLLCVQFILVSLLAHTRWLRYRRIPALVRSLVSLVLAMGCKETGAIAPLAIILLSFFMPHGSEDANLSPFPLGGRLKDLLKMPLSWAPAMAVLAVYLIFYRTFGFGQMNTLLYVSPLNNMAGYLDHLILHLPVMLAGAFSFLPPFVAMFFPKILLPMAVMGVAFFAIWLTGLWTFRRRPLVAWASVMFFLALLPQLSTDASERGLYFPMVFASIFVALVLSTIRPLARRIQPDAPSAPRRARIVGWIGVATIVIPGILISAIRPGLMVDAFAKTEQELVTAMPYIEQYRPQDILILNASGQGPALYSWDILNYHSKDTLDIWLLSAANGVFSLSRVDDSSFVITTDRHGWLDGWFPRVMRTGENLHSGKTYETRIFTATILEMLDDGSDVLSVRFELKRNLDGPGWLFLRWNGEAFEPLDIASIEIGQTVELADTSDFWKSQL